jgi:methylated-DNA-[protein]-cysteine S-methyltransferase
MNTQDACATLATCLGEVTLLWHNGRLLRVALGPLRGAPPQGCALREGGPPDAAGEELVRAFQSYFEGVPVRFKGIPELSHATDFQRAVWRATEGIPHGQTRTYGWVAGQIGRPNAARAVGAALGQNPVPIVIPCHRVVGANGALTGFGGGLDWKRGLLALERRSDWGPLARA